MGKPDEALQKYGKVVQIQEKTLGRNHPDTAGTYNNIGEVYRQHRKYPEALNMYQKSLDINIKVHGRNHPLVADTYTK